MSSMRFQTKSIDGKPVICYEQDIVKGSDKRKFDYKSRNQQFPLREIAGSQSIRGNDSYRGSECDSTAGRPDWNAPLKSRQRQTIKQRSQSQERDSEYIGRNRRGSFESRRKPQIFSDDEETVTLTKSQLAQLLSQTGITQNSKSGSRLNYSDEEERRLASPLDDHRSYQFEDQPMSLSEELARKRQQLADEKFGLSQSKNKPPVAPSQNKRQSNSRATRDGQPPQAPRSKRPPAENVMGLIAKLEEEQKQSRKKKPPPPIGGFRGKDQRMLQKKQAAGSDEDDELGMNNRKSKISPKQSKSFDKPSSQQQFDDEDHPSRGRHRSKYAGGDASDDQYESDDDRDLRRGRRDNRQNNESHNRKETQDEEEDPRIDAVMQRVIEENRNKMSEEDLVELLSQVYIELKNGKFPEKDKLRKTVKKPDHEETNGHHLSDDQLDKAAIQTAPKSLLEKKKLQWEREREELASIPNNAPWNAPVISNDSQRLRTNSRASSQQQSTHFTNNNSQNNSSRPSFGRISQLHQESLVPRGPMGDENTAMSFGTTLDEAKKKEADRRAWLDGLNQQRQEKRNFSHQEREGNRASDIPNNATNLRDRPF